MNFKNWLNLVKLLGKLDGFAHVLKTSVVEQSLIIESIKGIKRDLEVVVEKERENLKEMKGYQKKKNIRIKVVTDGQPEGSNRHVGQTQHSVEGSDN